MADSGPVRRPITPIRLTSLPDSTTAGDPMAGSKGPTVSSGTVDKMLCDRCGAEAYRMHAVWRCPACGFKSDCCGW
jgi:ribosomal protein L37E